MTFGSLFAGIGGFDLGFERAGMRCAWQVEIDEYCRRVLAKHWPNVPRWDDVRTFTGEGFERPDVICGGFPCKQTSNGAAVHGNHIGLAGKDSGLWHNMRRIIDTLRPQFAVVENPPSKWLDQVQIGLANIGYDTARVTAKASDFGAPHLRRRVFIVANRDGPRLALSWESGSSTAFSEPRRAADRNAWLSALSGVLRVDDGVPGGMDRRSRINAVGNAVVPQVAEWIGRRLMESQA